MSALDALRSGDLQASLAELTREVRSRPDDAKARVFLFQLLAVMGQWDRALTQLQVARELDAGAGVLGLLYSPLVQSEAMRRDVFSGRRAPLIFGEPEEWMAWMLESLRLQAAGEFTAAQDLRARACDAAPATAGRIVKRATGSGAEGESAADEFEWLADADPRFGPILEAVVSGTYYWVPIHRIRRVDFEPPEDLRDIVWTPCQFTWENGGEAAGFIPTRYPGTEDASDDRARLARLTDWVEEATGLQRGIGQRLLATNVDDYPLLEIRRIIMG